MFIAPSGGCVRDKQYYALIEPVIMILVPFLLLFNCLLVLANCEDKLEICGQELRRISAGSAARLSVSALEAVELRLHAQNPNFEGAKLSQLLANKNADLRLRLPLVEKRLVLARCHSLSRALIAPMVESRQCGMRMLELSRPQSKEYAQLVGNDDQLDKVLSYMEICRLVSSSTNDDDDDYDDNF